VLLIDIKVTNSTAIAPYIESGTSTGVKKSWEVRRGKMGKSYKSLKDVMIRNRRRIRSVKFNIGHNIDWVKEEVQEKVKELLESGTSEGVRKGWQSRQRIGGSAPFNFYKERRPEGYDVMYGRKYLGTGVGSRLKTNELARRFLRRFGKQGQAITVYSHRKKGSSYRFGLKRMTFKKKKYVSPKTAGEFVYRMSQR